MENVDPRQEQKMFKLLGIYYDSAERYAEKVPDFKTIEIKLNTKIEINSWGRVNFKHVYSSNGNIIGSSNSILRVCNMIEKDFCLTRNYNTQKEYFIYELNIANTEYTSNIKTTDDLNLNNFILEISKKLGHIPLEVNIDIKVTRQTDQEFRKQYYRHDRDYETPDEYFQKVCGAKAGGYTSRRSYRNPFQGVIRRKIFGDYKELAIFLLEYLYGKKLARNTTFRQIYNVLVGLPFDTFGIFDVQEMKKVEKVLRSTYSITGLYKNLMGAGLEPKTDLKRWKKNGMLQIEEKKDEEIPF